MFLARPERLAGAHEQLIGHDRAGGKQLGAATGDAGGVLVDEICQGVSPDTPFCEYGEVAPGQRLVSKFKIKVTASHGRLVVKGGVFSEEAVLDVNPFNQYLTRSVRITGSSSHVARRHSRSS